MVAQSLMAQGFANTMQMYGASAAEDQIGRGHGPLGHAQRLPPGQRGRNGRDENRSQYVINLGRVRAAEDGRTTLMVKNIPNKYTQRMLLETVQQSHAGKYPSATKSTVPTKSTAANSTCHAATALRVQLTLDAEVTSVGFAVTWATVDNSAAGCGRGPMSDL